MALTFTSAGLFASEKSQDQVGMQHGYGEDCSVTADFSRSEVLREINSEEAEKESSSVQK